MVIVIEIIINILVFYALTFIKKRHVPNVIEAENFGVTDPKYFKWLCWL